MLELLAVALPVLGIAILVAGGIVAGYEIRRIGSICGAPMED